MGKSTPRERLASFWGKTLDCLSERRSCPRKRVVSEEIAATFAETVRNDDKRNAVPFRSSSILFYIKEFTSADFFTLLGY